MAGRAGVSATLEGPGDFSRCPHSTESTPFSLGSLSQGLRSGTDQSEQALSHLAAWLATCELAGLDPTADRDQGPRTST